jgi:pimeloyl-ACP methyl ester carboxylesterase
MLSMSVPSPEIVSLEVPGYQDVPIAVRIRPGDAAVPVLLVHGFGSNGRANWSATGWLDNLERAGLTSVTVDLRGHGLSGRPHEPEAYRLPILVADLRCAIGALAEVLGPVPRIDLVGYSMGGRMVAELIATATGSGLGADLRPWGPQLPSVRRAVIGGYDGRPLFEGLVPAEFAAALAGAPGPDTPSRRIAAIATATRGNDLAAMSALVIGLGQASTALPPWAVAAPTLVVAGDRDAITDGTRTWAAGLPDGRHLELHGRNHISAITSSVFRSAATEFLTAADV